jgi:hypothetical protein
MHPLYLIMEKYEKRTFCLFVVVGGVGRGNISLPIKIKCMAISPFKVLTLK